MPPAAERSGVAAPCPVCKGPGAVTRRLSAEYRIVRCHACGLEFADPMRSAGPDWYAACSIYAEAEAGAQLRWEHEQFGRARLQGRRLLEVGCGRGAFVELAASQGYEVHGVDVQTRSLDAARRRVPRASFDLLDVERESPTGAFDIVTAFEVVEHLEHPVDVVTRLAGCLVQGGKFVISLPSIERGPFFTRLSAVDFPPHHLTMWTRRAVIHLLEAAGLTVGDVSAKDFDPGDFRLLLEDYFSLTSPLARRIAGRVCQGLSPLLRRWPTAGGCTLFAIGSKP